MKKIVFTFGRMNPPTIGHEKLANKIKKVASKEKADARIYLSHTNKPGSDPLSYNDKIKFANKAFGIAYKSNAKQIFQVVKETGDIDSDEMYRVFNMGLGMVIISSPENTPKVLENIPHSNIVGKLQPKVSDNRVSIKNKK